MKHYDILGKELNEGDFIATTDSSSYKGMHVYLILKLTPKGISVTCLGGCSSRTSVLYTEQYCIKLTQEDGEKYISLHKEYQDHCIELFESKKRHPEFYAWFEEKLNKTK